MRREAGAMKNLARAYLGYSMLWAVLFVVWIPYAVVQVGRVARLPDNEAGGVIAFLPLGCALLFIVLFLVSQVVYFLYVSRCFRNPQMVQHCRTLSLIGALSVPVGTVL